MSVRHNLIDNVNIVRVDTFIQTQNGDFRVVCANFKLCLPIHIR